MKTFESKILLEDIEDDNSKLITEIKNSEFTNGHKYKQCYFEQNKVIPDNYNCCLPCDIYCPNRIK